MDEYAEQNEDVEIVPEKEEQGRDAESRIKKLKEELARLDKERKEYLDGWQRAKADFINYKKDEGKRVEELLRFAAGSLVQELLVVLDSFDLAMGEKGVGDSRGILLIRSQLEDILKRHGLEAIAVSPGDMFNPEKHEAIGEEESGLTEGAIASVLQKGYMLHSRVIRPARVKISKGSPGGMSKNTAIIIAFVALEIYGHISPTIASQLPPDDVDRPAPLHYPLYAVSGANGTMATIFINNSEIT